MATPGFQELFESRIKNYFSCTKRLVRGYISKNYFIPPLASAGNRKKLETKKLNMYFRFYDVIILCKKPRVALIDARVGISHKLLF